MIDKKLFVTRFGFSWYTSGAENYCRQAEIAIAVMEREYKQEKGILVDSTHFFGCSCGSGPEWSKANRGSLIA
jgi:hypothetical protein